MRQTISITYMSGPLDGRTLSWEVPSNGTSLVITIGRGSNLHVNIGHDPQVSRNHAHLIYEPHTDRFFLVDKKSRNYTFVGLHSERLTPEEPHPIAPNTLFRVGQTWLRLDDLSDGSSAQHAGDDDD